MVLGLVLTSTSACEIENAGIIDPPWKVIFLT